MEIERKYSSSRETKNRKCSISIIDNDSDNEDLLMKITSHSAGKTSVSMKINEDEVASFYMDNEMLILLCEALAEQINFIRRKRNYDETSIL